MIRTRNYDLTLFGEIQLQFLSRKMIITETVDSLFGRRLRRVHTAPGKICGWRCCGGGGVGGTDIVASDD